MEGWVWDAPGTRSPYRVPGTEEKEGKGAQKEPYPGG